MSSVASARVAEYRRLLTEWQTARNAAPGCELSEDDEDSWMSRCHDVWVKMTEEELEELDALGGQEKGAT